MLQIIQKMFVYISFGKGGGVIRAQQNVGAL